MKLTALILALALTQLEARKLIQPLIQLFKNSLPKLKLDFEHWYNQLSKSLKLKLGGNALTFTSLLPLLIGLAVLLWFLSGLLWQGISFAIHLLLLIFILSHTQDLLWIKNYRQAKKDNNLLSITNLTEDLLGSSLGGLNKQEVEDKITQKLLSNLFSKLFLPIFWYLIFGPLGLLLAYLIEKMLHITQKYSASSSPQLQALQQALHWPAARFLGLTLSVYPDFKTGFAQFKLDLLRFDLNSQDFLQRQLNPLTSLPKPLQLEQLEKRFWLSLLLWLLLAALL